MLQKSPLGDEVRSILTANYPAWTRPNQVVAELERIGHDLSKLSNPQASIQMILKRMVDSNEAQEEKWPEDGKRIYRIPRTATDTDNPTVGMTLANIPERGKTFSLRVSDLMGNLDPNKLPEHIRAGLYGLNDSEVVHPLRSLAGRPPYERFKLDHTKGK